MTTNNYFGLMKFSEEIHIDSLINQGILKFSTLDFYQNKEKSKLEGFRFDKYEGYSEIINPADIEKITIDGRDFKVVKRDDPVLIKTNTNQFTHICCFNILTMDTFLDNEGEERIINPKLFEFGDSIAVIPYPTKENGFFERITTFFKNQKIDFVGREVNYIDFKKYTGKTGEFSKDIYFSYQKEFRLAISLNNPKDYFLKIGKIDDLAIKVNKKNLINRIEDGIFILS
ncbi:hypothetical protein P3G55_22435 [Leptospira sp. 96542]|nr:hypothetical protein [Leptospira sp. 96542]